MSKTLRTVAVIAGAVALTATGIGAAANLGLIGAATGSSAAAAGAITSATIFATATTVAAVASAVGFAATIGAQATAKTPPVRGSVSEVIIAAEPPSPYIMGRTYSGGVLRHDVGYGATLKKVPNPYRAQVLVHSVAGPLAALVGMYADYAEVPFSGNAAAGYYNDFLYRDVRYGQAPDSALTPSYAGMPNWSADHKLSGKAAILLNAKFDKDGKRFASGWPVMGAVWQGVATYDARKDSTYPGGSGSHRVNDEATWEYSDCPAQHALAYALGRFRNGKKVFGVGLPADGIVLEHFVELSNVCQANGWKIGGIAYEPGDRWANLKRILAAGGAEPLFIGGKLGLRINAPRVSIYDLDAGDLAEDDAEIPAAKTWRERRNGIRPKYRSEANRWTYVASDLVSVPSYIAEDGEEKFEELQWDFVQDKNQAAQLAAYKLVNGREIGPITLVCKPHMRRFGPGDMITLNLGADHALGGLDAVILKRSVDPSTMKVTLTLETETAGKHDFALGRTGTAPPTPALVAKEDKDVIARSVLDTDTIPWTGVLDDDPLHPKPEDGATVGGTIGVDIRIREIPDIPAPPGLIRNDLLKLRKDGGLVYQPYGDPAVEVELGKIALPDIGAASDAARRQLDDAVDRLGTAVAQALSEANRTRETFRDAGFYVDPASGIIKISAVEQTAEQLSEAYIRLSAAESLIALRATRTYVDNAIATAVLDPSQVPIFEGLEIRITSAELRLDGAEAAINQKATILDLNAQGARLTTAEQDIDALKGQIVQKVETVDFNALGARVTSAEQTLAAVADTASLTQTVIVSRRLPQDLGKANEGVLRGLLAGDAANRGQLSAMASARAELTAKINDDMTAEALARQQLVVKVGAIEAAALTETRLRIEGDQALAVQVTNLTASIADQLASFDQRIFALVQNDGLITAGLAQTVSAVRGLGEDAAAAAESALRALLAGDKADRDRSAAIAAAREELTVKLNGDVEAVVQRVSALLVRIGLAEASIVAEELARATANLAIASQLTQLSATIGDVDARIAAEELVRATQDETLAVSIQALRVEKNDDVAAVWAEVVAERQARIDADGVIAGSVETLRAEKNDDVAEVAAFVDAERQARIAADSIVAASVETLRAEKNSDIGDLSAEVATERQARIDGDGAISSDVQTLTATVNGHTASIQETSVAVADALGRLGAYWRVTAIGSGGEAYIQLASEGGQTLFVVGSNMRVTGDAFIDGELTLSKINYGTFIRRAIARNVSGSPAAGQVLALFNQNLGLCQGLGSYTITVEGSFIQNVGDVTSTYNGKPFYTHNLPDGGLRIRLVKGGATVAQMDWVSDGLFTGTSRTTIILNAGRIFEVDDGAAGNVSMVIEAIRGAQDSGIVDQGDYYERNVSAVYSNFNVTATGKWSFV